MCIQRDKEVQAAFNQYYKDDGSVLEAIYQSGDDFLIAEKVRKFIDNPDRRISQGEELINAFENLFISEFMPLAISDVDERDHSLYSNSVDDSCKSEDKNNHIMILAIRFLVGFIDGRDSNNLGDKRLVIEAISKDYGIKFASTCNDNHG